MLKPIAGLKVAKGGQHPPLYSPQVIADMLKNRKVWLIIIGMLFLVSLQSAFAWWNSNWQYRQKLTLDTTQLSNDVTDDLPIMVRVDSTNTAFWNHVDSTGKDVRFVASDDTTELKYHFEKFDYSNQEMIAWVKVTDTFTASSDIYIYMYYGNSNATDAQDEAGTYTADFNAVYHMDDASGGASDSTGNHNATEGDAPTYQATGKIGYAMNFDGSADYLNTGFHLDGETQATVTAWASRSTVTESQQDVIFGTQHIPGGIAFWWFGFTDSNVYRPYFSLRKDGDIYDLSTTDYIDDSTWHFWAMKIDGSNFTVFIDGENKNSIAYTDTVPSDYSYYIGAVNTNDSATAHFPGKIDEIKVISAALSDDAIKLLYLSESNQLITFGNEETSGPTTSISVTVNSPNGGEVISASSITIDFNIAVSGVSNPEVHVKIAYSTTQGAFENVIEADLNLNDYANISNLTCDDADFTDSTNCQYTWDLTNVADGNYYIDINAWEVSDGVSETDSSDGNFQIKNTPEVAVTSPNGSEIISGATTDVNFTVTAVGGLEPHVKIAYSTTQGTFETVIEADLNLDDYANISNLTCTGTSWSSTETCAYTWNLFNPYVPDGDYYIDINIWNAVDGKSSTDSSDSTFEIDNVPEYDANFTFTTPTILDPENGVTESYADLNIEIYSHIVHPIDYNWSDNGTTIEASSISLTETDDNFNDNSFDSRWNNFYSNGVTVSETNQQLEFSHDSIGDNWGATYYWAEGKTVPKSVQAKYTRLDTNPWWSYGQIGFFNDSSNYIELRAGTGDDSYSVQIRKVVGGTATTLCNVSKTRPADSFYFKLDKNGLIYNAYVSWNGGLDWNLECSAVIADAIFDSDLYGLMGGITGYTGTGAVSWAIDDFNYQAYLLPNKTHTFTTAGDHNICLKMTFQYDYNSDTFTDQNCQIIHVKQYPQNVDFMPVDANVSVKTTFVGSTDDNASIVQWYWFFPNPDTNYLGQDANHTFNTTGTLNVCLTVQNTDDLNKTKCKDVNVYGALIVHFYDEQTLAMVNATVNFLDTNYNTTGTFTYYLQGFSATSSSYTQTMPILMQLCWILMQKARFSLIQTTLAILFTLRQLMAIFTNTML